MLQRETGPALEAEVLSPVRAATGSPGISAPPARFRLGRLLAYTRREVLKLRRDPVRIGFALFGPMLLMMVLGYGISLDIENIPYAALDLDQTGQSPWVSTLGQE